MTDRLRLPAEWEPHQACWMAFPHLEDEWEGRLAEAQESIAGLCRSIATEGNEAVRLLVVDDALKRRAHGLIGEVDNVTYVVAAYGDCWTRDTLPLIGATDSGTLGALSFRFNGWGGKFVIPKDDEIGTWVVEWLKAKSFDLPVALEGGALEFDGSGTFITTASCVLDPHRNPEITIEEFEMKLRELVELERLVWLDRGMHHDHTAGHVDMVARFLADGSVLCMRPTEDDPNASVYRSIEATLSRAGLDVRTIPSPGAVFGPDGRPLPATYCNFYTANDAVIVPTYGVRSDEQALTHFEQFFRDRRVVGLDARPLLWGGGAFHCVVQPEPRIR